MSLQKDFKTNINMMTEDSSTIVISIPATKKKFYVPHTCYSILTLLTLYMDSLFSITDYIITFLQQIHLIHVNQGLRYLNRCRRCNAPVRGTPDPGDIFFSLFKRKCQHCNTTSMVIMLLISLNYTPRRLKFLFSVNS